MKSMDTKGKLYLCATPIGNLEDITLRVLRILSEVDLIAAEDTRHSIKLLNHYEIKTPMTSYHEHNKISKAITLVESMKAGKNIALITDAGMPGISDPGEELVALCYEEGIEVTVLPGASAVVSALALSGLATRRFCFEGFLPTDKKLRTKILNSLTEETRTIILYEAPHHLIKTLVEIHETLGNRKVSLCKEITKKFENVKRNNLSNLIDMLRNEDIKGEFVIVIEGKSFETINEEKIKEWEKLSISEHILHYVNKNIDKKDAMKLVAKDRGISKRDVYQSNLENKEEY